MPNVAAGKSWLRERMSYTSFSRSAGKPRVGYAHAARQSAPPQGLPASLANFRKLVWNHYRKHGRHDLPWRQTADPYKILVSEVMLQQTQVERVMPFYKNFIKQFPTAKRLASAPLSDVLKAWQGLGYNRRAKMLHQAAKELANKPPSGTRLNLVENLEKLPGVGPYTARAVAAFAFNHDVVFVETNIRTAVIHHFFLRRKKVSDKEIEEILTRLRQGASAGEAREWYAALMDYGAYLKKSGVKLNTKSKHYTKQSKFTGSAREARGAILKELSRGAAAAPRLLGLLGDDRRPQLATALSALEGEGLIQKRGRTYVLPR
jgi:A/G-specific adenine glycosylase